jgi:hypothetical protein
MMDGEAWMGVSVPNANQRAEQERAFEQWLLAALEHGRAQLATRGFVSPAIAAAIVQQSDTSPDGETSATTSSR